MNRAYSFLTVRAVDEDRRQIAGIATTPTPDRMGDIVEPLGVKFRNPLALLHQHRADMPVGQVKFDKPTKDGITFRATLPKIEEPGPLKDRVDTAWGEIKAGLVRAVSIGFRPIEMSYMDDGGYHFLETEVLELSLVTIPAQAEAVITEIRSMSEKETVTISRETINHVRRIDRQALAAIGTDGALPVVRLLPPPGVSGSPKLLLRPKEAGDLKTIAEQIAAFEATRAAKAARMEALMSAAAERGETLDAEEAEEYDGLETEVKAIDTHLVRLRGLETANAAAAKPAAALVPAAGQRNALLAGSGGLVPAVVKAKVDLPKGTLFTRYAMAVAAGKGSMSDTLAFAKRWERQTPEVAAYIKAVAGSTLDGTGEWGSELVYAENLATEFMDLLRPATIIGRIVGLRRVPFNVRIPVQTGGSTVNWVGERAPKPVSELSFGTVTLGYDKIAGIVVLTEELVRLSSPSAEEAVRRDLVEQIARFMDAQFVNPAVSATANNPASITNAVSAIPASGTDADALYYDLNVALSTFDNSEMGSDSMVVLMPKAVARGISSLRNALGQFEFTGMTPNGGTLLGMPVLVSNSVPAGLIIILKADEILMADDGQVRLDASNQATLDMNGGTSPNFNLFQRDCIAIRAERWITWKKRRAEAVAVIEDAAYGPAGPASP